MATNRLLNTLGWLCMALDSGRPLPRSSPSWCKARLRGLLWALSSSPAMARSMGTPARVRAYIWRLNTTSSSSGTLASNRRDKLISPPPLRRSLSSVGMMPRRIRLSAAASSLAASSTPLTALPSLSRPLYAKLAMA